MSATTHGAPDRGRVDVVRIPLTITATGSGYETDGVLVAVAVDRLDALEAENDRLRSLAVALWETLGEVQRDGQEKGGPLPTWRITVEEAAALDAALDRAGLTNIEGDGSDRQRETP